MFGLSLEPIFWVAHNQNWINDLWVGGLSKFLKILVFSALQYVDYFYFFDCVAVGLIVENKNVHHEALLSH